MASRLPLRFVGATGRALVPRDREGVLVQLLILAASVVLGVVAALLGASLVLSLVLRLMSKLR